MRFQFRDFVLDTQRQELRRGDERIELGEGARAKKIRDAVASIVKAGKVRAYDMMKLTGGPDVIGKGAASTTQITDAIIERLG